MYGALDIQDLIAWSQVEDEKERVWDEWTRLNLLCAWGQEFAIDGFVRMEMDL
jgi:hypothetical protein